MSIISTCELIFKVGMLSLGYPRLNMQFESPGSHDRLIDAVQKALPEKTVNEKTKTPKSNQQAFQVISQFRKRDIYVFK